MRRVVPGLLAAGAVVVVIVGLLLAAGSGVSPTGVVTVGEAPRGIARRSGQGIYLVEAGRVRLVVRPGPRADAARAVRTLLAGPTAAERAHRLMTRLPEPGDGAVRLGRATAGGVRVRLPGRPGRLSSLAVRQVACTVGRATLAAGIPIVSRAASAPPGRSAPAAQASADEAARVLIVDAGGRRLGAGSCPELRPKPAVVPRLPPSVEPSDATAPAVATPPAATVRPSVAERRPATPAAPR